MGSKLIVTIVWLVCGAGFLAWERMMIKVTQQAAQPAVARSRTEFTIIVLVAMSLAILGVWVGVWAMLLAGGVFVIGITLVFSRMLARRR